MNDLHTQLNCPSVAHLCGYIGVRYGGPPQVILSLSREMVRQGLGVGIWATGTSEERAWVESMGLAARVYRGQWPKRWFRSPALIRDLSNRSESVDLLHFHGLWTYVQQAASRLASRRDIPYVISPHGVLKPWSVRQKGFKKRVYLSLVARRMLNAAACLQATAPYEEEGFRQAGYDGPITIVPNGVDIPDYDSTSLSEQADDVWPILRNRRVVLFLSRISPEKGLDQLLPAFSDLARQKAYDDVVLVLTGPGKGPHLQAVTGLVESLGIGERILMTGFVDDEKKAMLMSRADVYTLPSYSEGFSMSVLENMAMGTPVLITTGCNFPEVVEAGAGLCCEPTRADLADRLKTLLDMSPDESQAMGRRGIELIRRDYTWPIVTRKLRTVYDCILHGKSTPLNPEPYPIQNRTDPRLSESIVDSRRDAPSVCED